jgi:glycosyltransferase involved in cell wall biosynthesis
MLVSVIVPAFNAEEWIGETLNSVINQTYAEIEVIVVDDGSADRTRDEAVKVLAEAGRPFKVFQQENRGVSAARNHGLSRAKGGWIQFLDSDDLLHSTKIETQMACRTNSADVLYSNWQKLVVKDDKWIPHPEIRRPLIGSNALADIIKDHNFQQIGSMLFRTNSALKVGGFNESNSLVEDVEFYIKLIIGNCVFVKDDSDAVLSWYRDRSGSHSKGSTDSLVEACIRNARLIEQHASSWGMDAEIRDAITDVYYSGANYFAGRNLRRSDALMNDIAALQPNFLPKGPPAIRALSKIIGYRGALRAAAIYRSGKGALHRSPPSATAR